MAGVQNFRSAFSGFNREDVVHYIEYMNNKHKSEVDQLNNQLQSVRNELHKLKAQDNSRLQAELDASRTRCAELEAMLEQAVKATQAAQTFQPVQVAAPVSSGDELEAYRRAERTERLARDRASQIYAQANAALADATVKVEAVSNSLTAIAEQMTAKTQDARNQLQEAVAAMYAIRPEEE